MIPAPDFSAEAISIPPEWLRIPPRNEDEIAERMMTILTNAVIRRRAAAEAAGSQTREQAA